MLLAQGTRNPAAVAERSQIVLRCSPADAEVMSGSTEENLLMARAPYRELEFETALTGVLKDIYDLRVRSERDPLNRRRVGYATLAFDYEYDGDDVKAVISIDGLSGSTFSLLASFSDAESIASSAEDCAELALAIRQHLDANPAAPGASPARRLED